MSDHWPMIAGIGAGVAAAAAVGQMIVSAVSLGQQYRSGDATEQEIAELKRRLERLQQTLRERGYLDNREDSTQASQARAQAMRARTIYELTEMEESLEKRVAAITSRPAPTNTQESRFNKMMVERGRRFLY